MSIPNSPRRNTVNIELCSIDGCVSIQFSNGLCERHYTRDVAVITGIRERHDKPRAACSFPECGRESRAKGYCNSHYAQLLRGVDLFPLGPDRIKNRVKKICSVDGCNRVSHCKGYCRAHYGRIERHGDINKRKPSGGNVTYHVLTDIDLDNRRATCSICGQDAYIYKRRNTVVCANNSIQKTIELKNLRRDYVNSIKIMIGCQICGYKANPAALEFHHVDRTQKEATVSALIGNGSEQIVYEIKKCSVLCANCHAILHVDGYSEPLIPLGDFIPKDVWDAIPEHTKPLNHATRL